MKILFTFLLSFVASFTLGQIKISYIFRDACTDNLLPSYYYLFQPPHSKIHVSEGKDLILDSSGMYTLGTVIRRNDVQLVFISNKIYKKGVTYTDTIIIPRFLPIRNAIQDTSVVYYLCGSIASGVVKDYYPSGIIRMEGNFLDGRPISNINYYNVRGRLVKKEIFKSGHYIDTKLYNNKDTTDYY